MYKVQNLFYLFLIVFHVQCQTSSEQSENEIPTEVSSDDNFESTDFERTDDTLTEEATEELFTTDSTSESPDSGSGTEYKTEENNSNVMILDDSTREATSLEETESSDTTIFTTPIPETTSQHTEYSPTTTTSTTTPGTTITTDAATTTTTTTTIAPTNTSTIIISLPTITPGTIMVQNTPATTRLCGENEVYTCLPLCPRTCNSPLSRIICRPVPSYFRLCSRGCTCKMGYLLEKTIRKCVKECPPKEPL